MTFSCTLRARRSLRLAAVVNFSVTVCRPAPLLRVARATVLPLAVAVARRVPAAGLSTSQAQALRQRRAQLGAADAHGEALARRAAALAALRPATAAARPALAGDVLAVLGHDVDRVGLHGVGPEAAGDAVDLAVARVDRVVAGGQLAPVEPALTGRVVAVERVRSGAADDRVVVEAAVDRVRAGAAVEAVGAVGGLQEVVALAAAERARLVGLHDLDPVRARGAGERAGVEGDQLLDVADVVTLTGPAVVRAAAQREVDERRR